MSKPIVPQTRDPRTPLPPLSYRLYHKARQVIQERQCWDAGETVTIWQGDEHSVYIRHTSRDLYLGFRNGKPERALEVQASRLNLSSGPFWPFTLTRNEYADWARQAQATLQARRGADGCSTIVLGSGILTDVRGSSKPGGER